MDYEVVNESSLVKGLAHNKVLGNILEPWVKGPLLALSLILAMCKVQVFDYSLSQPRNV